VEPEELVGIEHSVLNIEERTFLKANSHLVQLTAKFEDCFKNFHGPGPEDFDRDEGVNKRLENILIAKFNCCKDVAHTFVRARLQMRLRDLNIHSRNATLNCKNKSYLKYFV
jgi:hypothetical protein